MTWVLGNLELIGSLIVEHLGFALPPVLIGLALAVPLGWLANRTRAGRTVVINLAGLLYTVPSLALFVILPAILGTGILDPLNVIIALTVYTLALLVRTVADALSAVPPMVVDSATAMGYRPLRRFLAVELPLAVPVVLAGVRVAAVSSISLVTVGSVIGFGGLGKMFTDGFQRDIPAEIIAGIVLVLLIALLIDGLLLLIGRALTPWTRAGAGAAARGRREPAEPESRPGGSKLARIR
ncbi:MAG TPA: ABC transporter permease [Pseudonocardia sp.]|nr:ABC transporter permease [Pseudonocardia sp.]